MMPMKFLIFLGLAGLTLAGCAPRPPLQQKPSPTTLPATTQASSDTFLRLDQIQPVPKLIKPVASAPTTRPSLDAIVLFARAREALIANQRFTAINYLEQAIRLDPGSFELHFALGEAHQEGANYTDASIAAYESAARINPDDLTLQLRLGRQYLAKGNVDKGLYHLRLALQTSGFAEDDDQAGVVNFLLARALQQKGYDRAALDQYDELLSRLKSPSLAMRQNPELAYLIGRPEMLFVQIGDLYAKHGQWEEAMGAYEPAAKANPENFELQSRVVHAMLSTGKGDQASKRAAELVGQFRASSDSLALLRETYRRLGREESAPDELQKLWEKNPKDRAFLFAQADMLRSLGQAGEAEAKLRTAFRRDPDITILKRLIDYQLARDDVPSAAVLLIEAAADQPDMHRQITRLWPELVRATRKNHLRLAELQKLEVKPEAEASKLFWVAERALQWNRDILARTTLDSAVKKRPAFAPAFRGRLVMIWSDPNMNDADKLAASDTLVKQAESSGAETLALELRGLQLLRARKSAEASQLLEDSIRKGNKSPDVYLTYAQSLLASGGNQKFEQTLWKLISDRPTFDDAYVALFTYYWDRQAGAQAMKVLQTWQTNDPDSASCKILQANVLQATRQTVQAEQVLNKLLDDHPDKSDVLIAVRQFYEGQGRLDELAARLEEERSRHPENRLAVEHLVGIYAFQKRYNDAARVLDATRASIAGDPELLYAISYYYMQIDRKEMTEQVLEQVLRLDPSHPVANNDLGYTWVDAGKNLDKAEAMIRIAVAAEPDNESFLDSLGWALYKRGQYAEAFRYLEKASNVATHPDPVVIDHLGDCAYRLGQKEDAVKHWKRADARLQDETQRERSEFQQLRLQLRKKLEQAVRNANVDVAPIVEPSTKEQSRRGN